MPQCPVCHKEDTTERIEGKRSKYYPFCSERCKLIDLGAWLNCAYVINCSTPSEDPDVDNDGF